MKACFLFGLSAIGFYSLQIYAAALLVGLLLRGSSRPLPICFSSKKNLLSKFNCVWFLCLFSVWLAFCCLQIRMLCCLVCCHLLRYCEWLMGSIYLGCAILTFYLLHSRPHYFNPSSVTQWKWKSLSQVPLFAAPQTIQSMEFSRQDTGVGSLSLLQGIFPTQGSNPGFDPHCRWILQLSHKGSLLKSFIFKILKEKENSELLLFLSSFSCYSSK